MEEYVTQSETCRSKYLIAYFGQEDSKDCGNCDVCRSRSARERTERMITSYVSAHPGLSTEEFKAWCDDPSNALPPYAMELYREMLDEGKLLYLRSDES